jgi:hypothetical protein
MRKASKKSTSSKSLGKKSQKPKSIDHEDLPEERHHWRNPEDEKEVPDVEIFKDERQLTADEKAARISEI